MTRSARHETANQHDHPRRRRPRGRRRLLRNRAGAAANALAAGSRLLHAQRHLARPVLALFSRSALAEDANVPPAAGGGGQFTGFALAHNLASEAEVDALLRQAEAAGATITRPARKTDWGGYAGYFRDLDGHLWEIAHNPHFWVGPRDEDG